MDELPPKAAALLHAARHQHDPSRADSERVRHALAAALAAPALGAGGEQALTLGKTASRWLSASWIKGVALVGLVAGATLVATWKPAETAPAPRARVASAPIASVPVPAARASAASERTHDDRREPVAPVAAPTTTEVPASAAPPRRSAAPASARQRARAQLATPGADATTSVRLPAAQPEPAPAAPSELALMRGALERLNAGDVHGALEQLSLHATRFPNGVMTEERDGLRAVAWCKGGDPARGVAAAHGFLRLYPDSPLVARVRSACKEVTQ